MSERKLELLKENRRDPMWKTADDLHITASEFAALIAVRDLLASREIKHATYYVEKKWFKEEEKGYRVNSPKSFNMQCYQFSNECGTVHCIGGWMHFVMHGDHNSEAYVKHQRSASLRPLFYPPGGKMRYLSTDRAAVAIENFLCGRTTVPWDDTTV